MDASTVLSTKFVNKLPQTIPNRNYIIKTEWSSNDCNLEILDTHQSKKWQGNVSFEDIKQSAEELEIPYVKFFDESKNALTTNGGVEHFEYVLENDKFSLMKKDQFQIQYLELHLATKTDFECNIELAAVDLIASTQTQLSACQEAYKELNEKYQSMVKTMEKCLEEKNQLERNLLEKFSVLLNSKKDKIGELQDLLAEKNKLLEEAGLTPEESTDNKNKRKSTDLAVDNDSEDFMQATQVMTQPISRTLPKRVKQL